MHKRGNVLVVVLLGILATASVVPFLISNSETELKNNNAKDEANRILWAADGAACNAYKDDLKSISSINLDDMSIDKKGENLSSSDQSPKFYYNNNTFVATTTIDAQQSLHNEYGCWTAKAGAAGYDFKNSIKAVYVKPGVEYTNYGAYAWDKKGILYKIDNNKLVRESKITSPIWQLNNDLALDVNGKAWYLRDGDTFGNNRVMVAATDEKDYFGINNDNTISGTEGQVKWKSLTDNTSGILSNIVFAIGGGNHMLALTSNGDVYGWGDNSKQQITQKKDKNGNVKTTFSSEEAVLISDKEAVPTVTSNSYVDLTPYKDDANPIKSYLEEKYGLHPHHCRKHKEYNPNCNYNRSLVLTDSFPFFEFIGECQRKNMAPWGGDSLSENCDCDLCKEIRDVTRYDNRSKHLGRCQCDECRNGNLNWRHYWGCHCDSCIKERSESWGFDNVPSNKVPNPSTPLHVDEDTNVDNFQVVLDANSAYFSTGDYIDGINLFSGKPYRSVVDFRAKLVPKNPPTTDDSNDVGTYKEGITSNSMNDIYVIGGGSVDKDQTDFYDPLKKTWLVNFDPTLKKGDQIVAKLPEGDYEVIFESSLRFQTKDVERKIVRYDRWGRPVYEYVYSDWKDSGFSTNWERLAPFNMFFGIDPNKQSQGLKNNYFGGIFRLNNSLFNLSGGKTYVDENHTVIAAAAGDTFSIILAKNDASAKKYPNMYKLLTWGANENKQLGRTITDTSMNEVIFDGDNKDSDNYVAKNIRSLKAGKNQGLVLTDNGTNREIWTWGANTFTTPVKLVLDLDSPVVSIAAGDGKNMLITENDTVYEWDATAKQVNSNNIVSK
jgi:alpha-tubulin suppressor-like RCC1 family protein